MRDSRDIRNPFVGNVRLAGAMPLRTYTYVDPRTIIGAGDPILADLLEQRLSGKHVDLRKHLTGG